MPDIFFYNSESDYLQRQNAEINQTSRDYWNKQNAAIEQKNAEYVENLKKYSVNIPQEQYNIIKDAIADAENPEDEAYRWASALELSKQYNLPVDYSYKNLEQINAAIWGDKYTFTPKTNFKAIVDNGHLGWNTLQMGKIGSKIMLAESAFNQGKLLADDEDLESLYKKYDEYELENQSLQDFQDRNFIIECLKFGAQSFPFTGSVIAASAVGSLVAPGVGTAAAFATSMANAAGLQYMQMRKDGSSAESALGFSLVSGALQAVVETSLGNVAGALGRKSLGDLATEAVKQKITGNVFKRLVSDGTFKSLGLRLTKEYLKENFEEGLEEVWQDFIEKGSRALAAELGGYEIEGLDAQSIARDTWENFKGGVMGSLVLGLPTSAIKVNANVKEFADVRKAAELIPSQEAFNKATEDSIIWEGMSAEEKREAQKNTWEKAQARIDAQANEEAKKIAEIQDAAEGSEELKTGDEEDGEETTVKPVSRIEESGKLYTTEEVYKDADDNPTGGIFLAGDDNNLVEVNGENKATRYGYINWEYADGDQSKIIINDFKMGKGREGIRAEFFNDFAMKHPGVDIQWNTKGSIANDIKQMLIDNNPSGKKNNLNYYADANAVTDASTRAWLDREIDNNIYDVRKEKDQNGNEHVVKTKLTKQQRGAAIALLEAGAKRMGMSITDYVNKTFGNSIFGTREDFAKASLRQGEDVNMKAGGVSVGVAQQGKYNWKEYGQQVKAVIYAGEHADFSTWAHELAHIFQNQLDGKLKEEAEAAFNVTDGDWENSMYTFKDGRVMPAAEAFAYGFQDWLKTGKAENQQMKNIFQKFAEFIARAYNSLADFIDLNPKVTSVYEQLLAGDDSLLKAAEMAVEAEDRRYRAQMQKQAQEAEQQKQAETEQQKKTEEAEREEASESTDFTEEKSTEEKLADAENRISEATNETEETDNAIDNALENTNLTDEQKEEIAETLKDESSTIVEKAEATTEAAESAYDDEAPIDLFQNEGKLLSQLIGEPSIRQLAAGNLRTQIMSNLHTAITMEGNGKTAETIKAATGWEKNPDGEWKYETDDSRNTIKDISLIEKNINTGKKLTIGEVLNADKLYEIIPLIKDVDIEFISAPGNFTSDIGKKGIVINTKLINGQHRDEELRAAIAKEIQHVIQAYEYAINKPGQFYTKISEIHNNLHKVYNDMLIANRALKLNIDFDKQSVQESVDKILNSRGELEARNVARRVLYDANRRKDETLASTEADKTKINYQTIQDPELLEKLNSEPTIKVYRAMQVIDGEYYPPMATIVEGKRVESAKAGDWIQADENPELAVPDIDKKTGKQKVDKDGNLKWKFVLDKGGKDSSGKPLTKIPAAYNPYWHTSRSPLNDQFSSAYKRPNLVTVQVEVPVSELSSGYRAERAKDAVGEMEWHSGPVSSQLAEAGKPRKVILSRYCKIDRVIPDSEVAQKIKDLLEGTNIAIPDNTITPSLKAELEKIGVKVEETEDVRDYNESLEQEAAKKAQDLLFQDKLTMYGIHNLSEDALRHAVKMGGLANPSMAVVDTEKNSFTNFGEVSLIPYNYMLEKGEGSKGTFGADIYSPRYPSIDKTVTETGQKKVHAIFHAIEDEQYKNELEQKLINKIENSSKQFDYAYSPLVMAYLAEKGNKDFYKYEKSEYSDEVKDLIKSLGASPNAMAEADNKVILEAYSKHLKKDYEEQLKKLREDFEKLKANPKTPEWVKNSRSRAIEKLQEDLDIANETIKELVDEKTGLFNGNVADDFLYRVRHEIESAGKIDYSASEYAARELIENDPEFLPWAKEAYDRIEKEERIFNGFTPSGNRRYLAHTLENVSKYMRQQELQGGESFYYGLGSTRAKFTPNFKTLNQIKKARDRLVTSEEFEKIKEEYNERFEKIAEALQGDNDFDVGIARFEEAFEYGKSDPIGYLEREYKDYGVHMTKELAQEILDFATALRVMPTEYFETKYTRPVNINEFAGAIIPSNLSQDLKDTLANNGLMIEEYDSEAGNREEVTKTALQKFNETRRVLFQEEQTHTDAFKNWFGDWENDPQNASKVVDENGDPLVVYHGTYSGQFDVFDKNRANPENDFGKGFYFTDNDYDVSDNYEGGGPDFENKVSRLAERIQQDNEDLSYEEAEQQARDQLYVDDNLFEVYLSMKNPVYVGDNETDIVSELFDDVDVSEEDFDNEDDYYEELENARADRLEEVRQAILSSGYYGVEEAADKVMEFFYNGNGTLAELKESLNDGSIEVYDESDENQGYATNDIARIVAEALGYDGIIDTSVSEKFKNMNLDESTTHYIVFRPNQIKSATDNSGAFDPENPSILFQEAYHGSGADFDKFDTENFGLSGEGSMSFGYGTYVTDNEDIARDYAERQAYMNDTYKLKPEYKDWDSIAYDILALDKAVKNGEDFKQAKEQILKNLQNDLEKKKNSGYPQHIIEWAENDVNNFNSLNSVEDIDKLFASHGRHLYTIEIPDDGYLEWNWALDEKEYPRIVEELKKQYPELLLPDGKFPNENLLLLRGMSGGSIYHELEELLKEPKKVSKFLHSIGYAGIKYPAGTIHGNGRDAYNYVIFNDDDAKIVDKLLFQTNAELMDEAKGFDSWQEFMEYCETFHADDDVSPIPGDADAQWYQTFYETANGVQAEQEKNEEAVEAKNKKDGALPTAVDALFTTMIRSDPQMVDDFLQAVANIDAIDLDSEEWQQAESAEDAAQREQIEKLKDFIGITLSDYNWQTALKRIQGGHEISEGLRKRLIGEMTDSFKARDFRALYAEVMNDEQYAVAEEDSITAVLNKKLKKYHDIVKPTDDVSRWSPERRKQLAEQLANREIAAKIKNGSLKLDDELDAYIKSLNKQIKEAQDQYNELEKETKADYQRIADKERRDLLKLHEQLLLARGKLNNRNTDVNRKISKGLKITDKYSRITQNLNANYDEIFRKYNDLRNSITINAEVQAALDRQEQVAGLREDLNAKQKERNNVAEVKKMRIQLVKRAMRRVPFNRVDYENAKTVIAIQRMLEPNLLGGVNRFIGIDSPYLRGVISQIVTDSDYKEKILNYLSKNAKASQAFADFKKKLTELKSIKDFDSWTAKDRKAAIRYLPKENWVKDLNLMQLAKEREESIDLDIGMEEVKRTVYDEKTGEPKTYKDKEGNERNVTETAFRLKYDEELGRLVQDAVGADMFDKIVNLPFSEWTTEDLESLAQRIDEIYTEGRDLKAAKDESRKKAAAEIRKRIEDAIKETGITINDDDTPEEKERKQKQIDKILGMSSDIKGTEAGKTKGLKARLNRLLHSYSDMNVMRFARMLDGQNEGENYRMLYRMEDDCYNKKQRTMNGRAEKIYKVMQDNNITEGDLAQTIKVPELGTEFTVDELLYFLAADKDYVEDEAKLQKGELGLDANDDYAATSRNAVMFGNMMSDMMSQEEKEGWMQLDKDMEEALQNDTLNEVQKAELAIGQLDKKPGTTRYIAACHSKWAFVLGVANNYLNEHPQYKALMEAIEADYAEQYGRMNEVSVNEFNMPVHRVKAYVPLVRRESNGDTNENQVREDLLGAAGVGKQWADRGMTQRRVQISPLNQKPVQTGLFRTWGDSIERTEHFIAYAPYVRQLNAVYKSRDAAYTRRFIESRYGDGAIKYLDEYINEVANPNAGRIRERGAEWLHVLRGKTAPAYLGWKASAIIKQGLTSPWPYMQFVNPAEYFSAAMKFTFNPQMREAIKEKSVFMKMRRMDPVNDLIDEMADNAKTKLDRGWSNFSKLGMQGLELIDWACVAPGWLACYEKKYNQLQNASNARYEAKMAELKERNMYADVGTSEYLNPQQMEAEAKKEILEDIETEAIRYADDCTRACQPSNRVTDLAPLFKNSSEAMKAFLQFQTSLNVIWQNLRYDMPYAVKNKEFTRIAGTVIGYVMAGIFMNSVMEGLGGDDDDDEKQALRNLVYYSTTQFTDAIPIMGSEITNTMDQLITGKRGFYGSGTDMTPSATKLLSVLTTAKKGNWQKAAELTAEGIGLYLGAPVSGVKEINKLLGKPLKEGDVNLKRGISDVYGIAGDILEE